MEKTVKLKHGLYSLPVMTEFFYEGLAVARDGVIELPADKPAWIQRCYISGYNHTSEGKWLMNWEQLQEEVARQTA